MPKTLENLAAGDPLLALIQEQFEKSPISLEELARKLDYSLEYTYLCVHGGVDLTMAQIRWIANSLEFVIGYDVVFNDGTQIEDKK